MKRLALAALPPLIFGALFLAAWELAVAVFDLKPYFLAPPSKIYEQFTDNTANIWDATKVSGTNALLGLVAGIALGIVVSFVIMRFRRLDQVVSPLATAMNAIPIFILVAVMNNMFAITSQVPRRLMVTLVVFFIVLVNVAKGLTEVSGTHMELMRSYAAGEWTILRKVRVPNAIPYLFTALKIAAPGAVITAFVSEYFGGSQDGLGYSITSNSSASRNDLAWAYVVGACALGLTFYLVSVLLESVAVRRATHINNTE